MAPVNPHGCAKAFATQMVKFYRESYGIFAVNGIMYNHESPRRGENFVVRKICRAAAAIKLGVSTGLSLGDIGAERDWGDARDYVHGMWLSLQHGAPEDFIFATGHLHSVCDVLEIAFKSVGLQWKEYVKSTARFRRRVEPFGLVGDASKARRLLGWAPKTNLEELLVEMVQADLARLTPAYVLS